MNIKSNSFVYNIEEYKNALQKSLYDESWIKNLYTDKDNIYEIFRCISGPNYLKEASDFIRDPSVKKLILARNKKVLDEKLFSRIAEAGKAEQNAEYVEEIENITHSHAKKIEYLINEYSENSREFAEFTIKPYPENMADTWKPIKSFHITYENYEATISIEHNIIFAKSSNSLFEDYFKNRNYSKNIKRKYIKKEDVYNDEYNFTRKYLLKSKECFFTVDKLYHEASEDTYKLLYRGNQTVNVGDYEIPLFSKRILIGHIM